MEDKEYLKTIKVGNLTVKVGNDDYGQQYFYEYIDRDGNLIERGCGSYNPNYMECIYYELDADYRELARAELFGEQLSDYDRGKLKMYKSMFEVEYRSDYYGQHESI